MAMKKTLSKYQKGGSFEQYYKTVPAYKNDTSNYDLRAYYNSNPAGAANFARNINAHAPDSFKLPNHPTFSDESIYFNDRTKNNAGHWTETPNSWMYVPYNPSIKDTVIERKEFGGYSTQGYKKGSPDKTNPFNVIPSGRITMQDVPHPVYGQDNLGNKQIMMPGGEYSFPGNTVYEVPLKGNNMKLKRGGAATGHAGQFWDGEKWVSSGDGATFDNGMFYQNGGPTYMPGGAGPMFMVGGSTLVHPFAMNPGPDTGTGILEQYANQTMQMGGNAQVHPFAMNPGSGFGGGILEEYADETMKKGGHAKKQKKLSPQQMQMMMQAMAGAGQGQGAPMGMPPMGMPPQQGMMPPQQGMAPQGQGMMGSGGIHIKKSHEGRFTAYKERTGKTTEQALHSKDPHVRQMANFARNAANWHHEYGGPVMQNGGIPPGATGMFHPLAKYMANGGPNFGAGEFDPNMDPGIVGSSPASPVYNPPTGVAMLASDPADNASWRQGMSDDQANQNVNYGFGSTQAYDPSTGNTDNGPGSINGKQNRNQGSNNLYNNSKVFFGGLGAGLGVAAAYGNLSDERRMSGYRRSLGTSDNIAKVNQPGGKGDWDQYGNFRPNQNTPVRPGMYYPMGSSAPVTQYGGTFAMGGKYSQDSGMYRAGEELEMDDAEIARLQKLGYKIQML